MPNKRQYIQHIFNGGWATDLGQFAPTAIPDQNGTVQIPFLLEAEDIRFELDGSVRKMPGASKLNSSALESGAAIRGIYDYWRQGTGGSPAQKRVIYINGKIYKDDADGAFTSIKTGLTVDAIPNFSTFDDFLIIANNKVGDVPMSWDQSTFQNLAGTPPNFGFSTRHKNSQFAAGVLANPSTLYNSNDLDPEAWAGATSSNISIDPNDGDAITGLVSYKNELWVFKGPYKGSIHRVTGSVFGGDSSDVARKTFVEGVGAVGMGSIFTLGDDIGFMWSDGTIRTLQSTAAFGDFKESALSTPIQSWLDEHLTFNALDTVQTAVDGSGRRVYIALPIDASTTPNVVLLMDARFNPIRWSKIKAYDAVSLATVQDSSKPRIFIGGSDGFVRITEQASRSIDATTGLSFNVKTPFMNYGLPNLDKILAYISLGYTPHNIGSITFGYTRDNEAQQAQPITQAGGNVLAPASVSALEFTLDDPVKGKLGGSRFVNEFFWQIEGGAFRTIQYQITNAANNEDVQLNTFGVSLGVAGENTEN